MEVEEGAESGKAGALEVVSPEEEAEEMVEELNKAVEETAA
jgi:hypothetical protein